MVKITVVGSASPEGYGKPGDTIVLLYRGIIPIDGIMRATDLVGYRIRN